MNLLWFSSLVLLAYRGVLAVAVDNFQLRRAPLEKTLQPGAHQEPEPKEAPEEKNKPAVVKVEDHVRKHHGKLMDAIDKFRAEVCYKMKDEFGVSFKTFKACHKFMVKACKPGEDMSMDGDHHEISSGKGYCKEYFPEAEKKAQEEVDKEEAPPAFPLSGPGPGPGPAPAPAPAPASKEVAPAPAPKASKGDASAPAASGASPGPAPAPGPMGAPGPGPAPVPAPFIPGVSGGKPYGPIGKDEAYYYKGGGKDVGRLHMSESMKLPTQGYWGKLVEHEDGETQTSDWMKEFGPNSGHDNVAKVCKEHPENEWCMRRGYGRHSKGSSPAAVAPIFSIMLALLASAF